MPHYDLYKRYITNTPFCSCRQNEDVYHFFFACKNYSKARNNLFNQLFMLDLVNIDTNLLICGVVHLPLQTNINFINLQRNLLDSPKIFILLPVNYHYLFRMTYCITFRRGASKLSELVPNLFDDINKMCSNKYIFS